MTSPVKRLSVCFVARTLAIVFLSILGFAGSQPLCALTSTERADSSPGTTVSCLTWTNAAGGNWSVAANWSPNQVPGASDSVLITADGTYTVVLADSVTVSNLTLGGPTGQQT